MIDGNDNVTFKQNGAFVVGHAWSPPRSTTWVRIRLDDVRVTVWDSSSGTFTSPSYDSLSHTEFVTTRSSRPQRRGGGKKFSNRLMVFLMPAVDLG